MLRIDKATGKSTHFDMTDTELQAHLDDINGNMDFLGMDDDEIVMREEVEAERAYIAEIEAHVEAMPTSAEAVDQIRENLEHAQRLTDHIMFLADTDDDFEYAKMLAKELKTLTNGVTDTPFSFNQQ